MNIIVSVCANGGIGNNGSLLLNIPSDMKRFRALTIGGTVIMGRKTLDSLPGGKALPNRRNIVITRDKNFVRENVEVAHSTEEALSMVAGENPDEVWVIGGGEIYKAMLPYCRKCYITHVNVTLDSDTFFPEFNKNYEWEIIEASDIEVENGCEFQFVTYRRRA